VVGVVFFEVVAMVAVVTSVWCSAVVVVVVVSCSGVVVLSCSSNVM